MKKIKADPFSTLWLIYIIYEKSSLAIPIALAIFIHELGHILAARILKIKIKSLELSMLGARLSLDGNLSYGDELLIALAGPFMGIIGYIITSNSSICSQNASLFSVASLALSIFNLFPLPTLDGGRIVKCSLCLLFSLESADEILSVISFFTLFFFWLLSVYYMIRFAEGLSAFVFCSFFFAKRFVFSNKTRDFESF